MIEMMLADKELGDTNTLKNSFNFFRGLFRIIRSSNKSVVQIVSGFEYCENLHSLLTKFSSLLSKFDHLQNGRMRTAKSMMMT